MSDSTYFCIKLVQNCITVISVNPQTLSQGLSESLSLFNVNAKIQLVSLPIETWTDPFRFLCIYAYTEKLAALPLENVLGFF